MNLFSEMISAVQSDLTIDDTSSFIDRDTVKLALNRAYEKAKGLYRWPEKEAAEVFSTENNKEFYDIPEDWAVDSCWRLEVDGTTYGDKDGSPLGFKDYLYERDNNYPNGNMTIWSVYGRKVFIAPKPSVNGNKNATIWGEEQVDPLVEDDDTTIFSSSRQDCNEAVVLEATSILKQKGDEGTAIMRRYIQGSQLLSIEAKQILENAWTKIQQNQVKYDQNQPYFEVPDFFPDTKKTKDIIGNF